MCDCQGDEADVKVTNTFLEDLLRSFNAEQRETCSLGRSGTGRLVTMIMLTIINSNEVLMLTIIMTSLDCCWLLQSQAVPSVPI
jgi:hypothetical protein